jgi:hypothetical protein
MATAVYDCPLIKPVKKPAKKDPGDFPKVKLKGPGAGFLYQKTSNC